MIENLLSLVRKHENWRGKQCLNLIPSENVMSPQARALLSSDLGHRYTSRDNFYMGTRFLDEIEKCGEEYAKTLFKAETADLRPLSGHVADFIFLANFAKPNDTILCVSPTDGGYPGISQDGLPKFLKLKVQYFPFSKEKMNVKVDEAKEIIMQKKPKIVIFGASLFLFPHPVKELAKTAKENGALVGYDGSHVMGLIAGNQFQSPLLEGASALFGSTHKSFFGPQGGIILAEKELGETMKNSIHPSFVDNAHWNRIAALTLALAEMLKFGKDYAMQVVKNSQALAKTLADYGLPAACPNFGYTRSHQVFLDYGGYKQGRTVAKRLEKANIIADCGVRLGTCEVTRRGMKENEMQKIAEFIKRAVMEKEKSANVRKDVVKFVREFSSIKYCFEE
ncbi:MAG: hypothetical protein QXE76_06215 [Candidatus Bathyarchaeia archaeon]